MSKIYLVRHGKAAAGWHEDPDPGLDAVGRGQAEAAARALAPRGPLSVLTSPLRRARETSIPLSQIWGVSPRVEERFGEIPSSELTLSERTAWFQTILGEKWPHMDVDLRAWRRSVLEALRELRKDTVVFSHFIAINVVVGEATGDHRVCCFSPENGSITEIEVRDDMLALIARGNEAVTRIL